MEELLLSRTETGNGKNLEQGLVQEESGLGIRLFDNFGMFCFTLFWGGEG